MQRSIHLGEIFLAPDFDRFEKQIKLAYQGYPRIALLGRSNVGKSTLVNLLLSQRIAHVSKKPGKTRGIHFYLDQTRRCIWVDVPGYGFASRSQTERRQWAEIMERYLEEDENLSELWLLLDARHGPTAIDLDALNYFHQLAIPLRLVMTKSDQLKSQKQKAERKKEVEQILADRFPVNWISRSDASSVRALFR